MASGGGPALALDEAARALGVSTDLLSRRLDRGDLPEAEVDGDAVTIRRDLLPTIAQREGWLIDLSDGGPRDGALDDLLERLLDQGRQLTEETAARRVAEATVVTLERERDQLRSDLRDREQVIEQLEAENVRLGADLARSEGDRRVAETIAEHRRELVKDLQAETERARQGFEQELTTHRNQHQELRLQLERARTSMGWWSRRRFERS